MPRFYLLPVMTLLACACEQTPGDMAAAPEQGEAQRPVEEIATFSGADAYRLACAGCHEEGVDGAPKTGDPEAWSGRSWLWEAVLFEHAKKGYQAMPPKGGHDELSDDLVEKAAEYMLNVTTGAPSSE